MRDFPLVHILDKPWKEQKDVPQRPMELSSKSQPSRSQPQTFLEPSILIVTQVSQMYFIVYLKQSIVLGFVLIGLIGWFLLSVL